MLLRPLFRLFGSLVFNPALSLPFMTVKSTSELIGLYAHHSLNLLDSGISTQGEGLWVYVIDISHLFEIIFHNLNTHLGSLS